MNDDREIFERLAPPAPPAELRDRVLSAAGAALAREPRGIWTRTWESRSFRLGWAASVALLAAAIVLVPAGRRRAPSLSAAVRGGDRDLGAAIRVPSVDPDARAWSLLDENRLLDRFDRPNRPPTSSTKEKSS